MYQRIDFSKLEYAFGNNTDQIKKYTRYDGPFRINEPGILNFRATKEERSPSKTVSVPIEILNFQNGLYKKLIRENGKIVMK